MKNSRIWEIDLLKVAAIFLMVIYHFIFDLSEFTGLNINVEAVEWVIIQKLSSFLFIFIAGVNSGFGKNNIKRGLNIFAYGMFITASTYVVFKDEYIRFGVLHLIGLSLVISLMLRKLNSWELLIIAVISYITGIKADKIIVNTFLLIPFGFMYNGFKSFDYYPVFPYISYFILGLILYKVYYSNKKSIFKFSFNSKIITSISQNSLFIYLIHQPVLLGFIYAVELLH